MSISTTDFLIAIGVYAVSIVATLLWVHRSSQESIARSAKSYLGIALRMALVHGVMVLFCGYTGLSIRWVALPLNGLFVLTPSSRLMRSGSFLGGDIIESVLPMLIVLPSYAVKQYILGFPDRDILVLKPEITIPNQHQRQASARPRPSQLSGQAATVVATLKPSGTIRIGDQQHSATSEGSLFIDAGEEVTVCGERNGTLVARQTKTT